MAEEQDAIGRRIAETRRKLGLTQRELAARIGISLGTLDRYEQGAAVPERHLDALAKATRQPREWLTNEVTSTTHDRERDLDERQRELDGRQAELDERERGLADRERAVRAREQQPAPAADESVVGFIRRRRTRSRRPRGTG